MSILTVSNLSKNYGNIQALKDVTFQVPEGSVFGILGPNGSGKTTLLAIVMSILKPTSGSYQLFNETPTDAHRTKIGTLLETPNFYHYLSGARNLLIAAAIKNVDTADIDRVLDIVNLSHRKNSPFSSYSLGMKQRLAIGAALLGNPDVLVFDEPTNGLDPVGIAEIRTLIKKLSHEGKTIIMASHLLDEVEKVCTHVAILKQGKLLTSGNVQEIFTHDDIVQISSENNLHLIKVLPNMPGYSKHITEGNFIDVYYDAGVTNITSLNAYCFSQGVTLSHLQLKKQSLENKFFELTNS